MFHRRVLDRVIHRTSFGSDAYSVDDRVFCGLTVVVVGLWFDRVSKNHCHLFFCHGQWLLEGSQATIKPHPTRQNHKPQTTRHKPPATSHTQHTTLHKPSQAKPSRTVPHHNAKKQAGPNQARPLAQGHLQFKENVVDASASPHPSQPCC